MGDRSGAEGDCALGFCAWSALRLLVLEEDIFHENVLAFRLLDLERCLCPPYKIQEAKVNSLDLRFSASRHRAWRHLTLEDAPTLSLQDFVDSLKAPPITDHTAFMVAEVQEIEAEISWAANRPTSTAKHATTMAGKTLAERALASLTATEQDWLKAYEAKNP